MEYKMKGLSEYDASYIKAVYYNDLNIVHLQNYDRISNMISNLEKYLNENEIIIKDNNIINLINQKFEYELYDIDYEEDENNYNEYYLARVYYLILSYILKKDLEFEIDNYKANRYFLDIIIDTLTPNKEFNIFRIVDEDYYNNRNTSFIPNRDVICYSNRARGIIEDIVNIVRHYDSDLKERALLHFDLLEEYFLSSEEVYYEAYNRDVIFIDTIVHELIISYNEKQLRNSIIKEQGLIQLDDKSLETSQNSDETNSLESSNHNAKYVAIHDLLKDYITYSSPAKIDKIIQFKINKETINKKHSKLYFALIKNITIDAAKIGKCFCLSKEEINHFVRFKKGKTRIKIDKNIPSVELEPLKEGIDKILIKIRNEYLHEINPDIFKLIQ
ncbi:MAG: hypothetical protein PHE28_07105 [Bacteroidales bacterium]|nr:hypothetical protein [Bacteroidales bacterium]